LVSAYKAVKDEATEAPIEVITVESFGFLGGL
jgi:hypothetical protein